MNLIEFTLTDVDMILKQGSPLDLQRAVRTLCEPSRKAQVASCAEYVLPGKKHEITIIQSKI